MYLAKGIHGTTAIEGNTLSEDEVRALIEGRGEVPRSREYLKKEVLNIWRCLTMIAKRQYQDDPFALTPDTIKLFNRHVLDGLDNPPEVQPGTVRRYRVRVGRYPGAPWQDCEYLLAELCSWLNGPEFSSDDNELRIPMAILKAIVAHVYIAWIHPFGDGNGRTARLVEVMILLRSGVPSPVGHLLSNHYNLTRSAYVSQLSQASARSGDVRGFVEYAAQGLLDGLREQRNTIRETHLRILWQHLVTERLTGGVTEERQRTLLIQLSTKPEPVPIDELRDISPEMRSLYAQRTDQTVRRDVQKLLRMGLLKRVGGAVSANLDMMTEFLPASGIAPNPATRD